jgi:tight adherence protein C
MNFVDFIRAVIVEITDRSTGELVAISLCVCVAVFSLIRLWAVGNQEQITERLHGLTVEPSAPDEDVGMLDRAGRSKSMADRVGSAIAKTMFVGPTDSVRLSRLLSEAGISGGQYRLATLVTVKLCLAVTAGIAGWLGISYLGLFASSTIIRFIALLGVLLVGWRLPDVVLRRFANARRKRIEQGLPDALDLLVISAEAGLSFEQGIELVSKEMAPATPDLSAEFAVTSAELRVLGDRRQALTNFADRLNVQAVRSIVATLSQTMRYGTPLAQSLRLLAAEMRTTRLLRMEQRAARMPVLLTIPLMCFILPSLVIVCAGPAILQGIDAFKYMLNK